MAVSETVQDGPALLSCPYTPNRSRGRPSAPTPLAEVALGLRLMPLSRRERAADVLLLPRHARPGVSSRGRPSGEMAILLSLACSRFSTCSASFSRTSFIEAPVFARATSAAERVSQPGVLRTTTRRRSPSGQAHQEAAQATVRAVCAPSALYERKPSRLFHDAAVRHRRLVVTQRSRRSAGAGGPPWRSRGAGSRRVMCRRRRLAPSGRGAGAGAGGFSPWEQPLRGRRVVSSSGRPADPRRGDGARRRIFCVASLAAPARTAVCRRTAVSRRPSRRTWRFARYHAATASGTLQVAARRGLYRRCRRQAAHRCRAAGGVLWAYCRLTMTTF